MSFQVFQAQGLRIFTGDTATVSSYTGNAGEIAVNTETKSVRILDGVNAGGTPLTTADAEELIGLSLDQLADLALSSPNEGDTLVYKNGSWTNDRLVDATAAVDEMSKMIDVEMTDLQTGHVLAYNATSQKWVNQATATVDHNHDARYQVKGNYLTDTSNLGEVNDVQITAPADGQALVYDAGKWVNSSAGGGGFTEITPFAKEFSFSNTVNYEQTLTGSSVLNSARWVLCDIFITASTSDHQNFKFSRTNTGSTKNWIDSRGQQPSSQFGNLTSQQLLTLTYYGESDGFSSNYGIWYASQWLPTNGAKLWMHNYGNSGSTGWVYIIVKGWKA